MKIPENLFRLVFGLHKTQPWLGRYESELLDLMKECQGLPEQQLLVDLLSKFCYLDSEKHASSIESVCKKITEDWGLSEESVQVVACTADLNPDSGQQVVYEIKTGLGRYEWQRPFAINRYDRAQNAVRERRNIVLVDEFVGSGRTMAGRIRTMRRQFAGTGVDDAKFYVAAYAGMEFALPTIRAEECEDIFFVHELKKGITEQSLPDDVGEHLDIMDTIEDRLAAEWNDIDLPRRGWAACEALYGRYLGNAPNSVFPVFWWPLSAGNKARKTIFTRR